jgi:hypothetical protein
MDRPDVAGGSAVGGNALPYPPAPPETAAACARTSGKPGDAGGAFDSDTATGMMPVANHAAGLLASRRS